MTLQMKVVIKVFVLLVCIWGLTSCKTDCTQAELAKKLGAVGARMQQIETSGQLDQIADSYRSYLDKTNQVTGYDLSEMCEIADDFLDEMKRTAPTK